MSTRPRTRPRLLLATSTLLGLLACRDQPPAISTTAPSGSGDGESTAAATLPASATVAAAPRPIAFDPPLEARDVDSARTALSVTFDRAMDPDGWAWVIESKETSPEIGESSWDTSLRVNSAQVKLEPGRSYVVWINSTGYPYFRDTAGRTVVPVRWAFSTAPGPAAASTGIGTVPAH